MTRPEERRSGPARRDRATPASPARRAERSACPVPLPSEGQLQVVVGRSSDSRAFRPFGREPTGRRFPIPIVGSVRHDGGRSRSPLRGSPGFTPGSLFTPRIEGHRRPLHHIGGADLSRHGTPTSDRRPRLVSPDESGSRAWRRRAPPVQPWRSARSWMPTAVRFCPLSTTRWVSPGARSSPSRGWPGWAPCWPPSGCRSGRPAPRAPAHAEGDLKILNVALGLEHEAIAAYQAGAESKLLDKPVLDVAVLFQSQHKAHRDALAAAIKRAGGTPVEPKKMSEYSLAPARLADRRADVRGQAGGGGRLGVPRRAARHREQGVPDGGGLDHGQRDAAPGPAPPGPEGESGRPSGEERAGAFPRPPGPDRGSLCSTSGLVGRDERRCPSPSWPSAGTWRRAARSIASTCARA